MQVILAKEYGFCHGVRNALDKLDKLIADEKGKNVYSIGEIIHNQDVIAEYKDKGVKIAETIADIHEGTGVVRAHGLPQSEINQAKSQGYKVIDATCAFVRKISRIIEKELDEKTAIYLIGEPNHPEVIAATHDFTEHVEVIDHKEFDPSNFVFPRRRCVLISQTTMSENRFQEIACEFISHCDDVHIYNTICPSTRVRQSSAEETAKKVDAMLIIGGKKSSNTRRLFELCADIVDSYLIERVGELDLEKLKGKKIIGITAGASTPDWIVQEAVNVIEKLG